MKLPEFDKAGFCCKCHQPVAEFNGSRPDGSMIITRLLPNCEMVDYRISNGSILKVCICTECKPKLLPEDSGEVMENVINGWQWELDNLVAMEEHRKNEIMKDASKLHITSRVDKNWSEEEHKKIKKPDKKKLKIRVGEK